MKLLKFVLEMTYFNCRGEFYQHKFGMAMLPIVNNGMS